jgi:biopolymer transport protein ExbD
MKLRTETDADVNITSMIDCLMMIIIFFMTIMSAQYIYGVAIKFPTGGPPVKEKQREATKDKYLNVYIQADLIDTGHTLVQPGILKLNGEEIPLVVNSNRADWPEQEKHAFAYLKSKMLELIKQGYKNDMLMIQGEMKTYHEKTMAVIDLGKECNIDGFSLVPPVK